MKLGLMAMFKNEGHILYEFINHYMLEGVDQFILIDDNSELIMEMIGSTNEISKFIEKVRPFGILELTRSGVVSMALGLDYIKK